MLVVEQFCYQTADLSITGFQYFPSLHQRSSFDSSHLKQEKNWYSICHSIGTGTVVNSSLSGSDLSCLSEVGYSTRYQ
jgi:hypothetical protein